MMPLMVAGSAVNTLTSLMLAAAIARRAHTVMRLRVGVCELRAAPSVIVRFMFRMPPRRRHHRRRVLTTCNGQMTTGQNHDMSWAGLHTIRALDLRVAIRLISNRQRTKYMLSGQWPQRRTRSRYYATTPGTKP